MSGDDLEHSFAVTDKRRTNGSHSSPVTEVQVSAIAPEASRVDAVQLSHAAVAALNRRDPVFAVRAASILGEDRETMVAAVTVLTDILLTGVPRGALKPGTRIDVGFRPTPGDPDCPKARDRACDLLTALAAEDQQAVDSILGALTEQTAADVLVVLLFSAAARLEHFVGLDGDTADAYYATNTASSSV
jgi:hypothetical protein